MQTIKNIISILIKPKFRALDMINHDFLRKVTGIQFRNTFIILINRENDKLSVSDYYLINENDSDKNLFYKITYSECGRFSYVKIIKKEKVADQFGNISIGHRVVDFYGTKDLNYKKTTNSEFIPIIVNNTYTTQLHCNMLYINHMRKTIEWFEPCYKNNEALFLYQFLRDYFVRGMHLDDYTVIESHKVMVLKIN